MDSKRLLERADAVLNQWERDVRARDPAEVLRRGYSITRANGRMVRDAARLKKGALIETTLHRGKIVSTVEEVKVND